MKKYTLLLVTLALLASCGTETSVAPEDVTNELPQAESPSVIEEIEKEISTPEVGVENLPTRGDTSTEAPSAVEAPVVIPPPMTPPVDNNLPNPMESKVIELNQTYTSPGGEEKVAFSISMDGEKITSVKVVGTTDNEISEKRIKAFADAVNSSVSGKTLEEAEKIKVVGGSSLTTGAFTAALKSM